MRKQIYVCNSERTTETGNRSGTHSSAGSTSCPGSCWRSQRKGPAGARCGGSTLGAAPTCRNTPRQCAPSHSQALVLLTSLWSLLLGSIQRTRSRATTAVPCLSSPPLQPLKLQRFESFAYTAGCCLYKARRHVIYYTRGDHPFSGQKSR